MKDFSRNTFESLPSGSSLQDFVREGAQRLVRHAVMAEFNSFFENYHTLKDEDGKQVIVRNGYHKEREVMTAAGNISIKIPRVNDRRKNIPPEEKVNFESKLIPRYLRRAKEVDEFIPFLYLKGISTGDFSEVLSRLLGQEVSISSNTVSRLKKNWESEYGSWTQRNLSGKQYVYWWVDGIYFNVRMESERSCILVIVGVQCDGKKELVAVEEGPRESSLTWESLLLRLKAQGLTDGPLLATADGALGFWKALKKIYPQTAHQRCWVHKTANVLDKLPKSLQSQGKRQIHEVYMAPSKEKAIKALEEFVQVFESKYPKATQCLLKDKDQLFAFYDFPAEHWIHIRSTNVIESTFATVRLRTYKTKGCLSRKTALTMVFKLVQAAQKRWQRIHRYKLLLKVLDGEKFINGVRHAA